MKKKREKKKKLGKKKTEREEGTQTGSWSQQPTVTEVTSRKGDRWMERMGLRTKGTREGRGERKAGGLRGIRIPYPTPGVVECRRVKGVAAAVVGERV